MLEKETFTTDQHEPEADTCMAVSCSSQQGQSPFAFEEKKNRIFFRDFQLPTQVIKVEKIFMGIIYYMVNNPKASYSNHSYMCDIKSFHIKEGCLHDYYLHAFIGAHGRMKRF